jgi:alcohol dehydrogenase class IV
MKFEFATAARIIFGAGSLADIGTIASDFSNRAFIITGSNKARAERLIELLKNNGIGFEHFSVSYEPTTTIVKEAVEHARASGSGLVISIGGGSVIDTGKAVAAMMSNPGQLEDYLEVVGAGKPLTEASMPHIAIPTTAGTGAEVTRNSVLKVEEKNVKVSIRSPFMLPSVALVDPELTYSMPPAVTASTGLDALTQLMEVYVSKMGNPLTDGICVEGLQRASRSLKRAFENGSDVNAREDISLASLFGGLALANAKLGAVHGFAGVLGGMIDAPHGVICASLLASVLEVNVTKLQEQAAAIERFEKLAQILTGQNEATAADGVQWVHELCSALNVERLGKYGLLEENLSTAAAKSKNSSSMKGNPVELSETELLEILKKSL